MKTQTIRIGDVDFRFNIFSSGAIALSIERLEANDGSAETHGIPRRICVGVELTKAQASTLGDVFKALATGF